MEKWNKVFKWGVIALASLGAVFFIILPLKEIFLRICCAGMVGLAIYYFVQFEKTSVEKTKSQVATLKPKGLPRPLILFEKISRLLISAARKIKSWILGLDFKKIAPIVFLACLMLIILINLEKAFTEWQTILFVAWILKITATLKSIQLPFILICIISGFFTIFLNKEKIEKTKEEEKNNEILEGQKRKDEFPRKYPKINKIPLLRNLIRWMYREGWFYSVLLIIVCFSFLGFGLVHLGQFISTDEPKWLDIRVPQLYEAIKTSDWDHTYISDKPGTLPAFLAGITNIFLDKNDFGPKNLERYLFWWRLPILFFDFIILFLIYYFLKKLLNKNCALLTTAFIAHSPVLVGISQIVNPDAVLWSLSFLTFIFFLLYLKTNNLKYILYGGVALGFSLVTKYFASYFYIFLFLTIYLEYLLNRTSIKQFFHRCFCLILLYGISFFTFVIFSPFSWGNYQLAIKGTFGSPILAPGINKFLIFLFLVFMELILLKGKISNYLRNSFNLGRLIVAFSSFLMLAIFLLLLINTFSNELLFNFNKNVLSESSFRVVNIFSDAMVSLYTMALTMTFPLLSIFLYFIFFLKKKWADKTETHSLLLSSVFAFIFLFIAGALLGGFSVNTKYQTILCPLYGLLGAIFFLAFFKNSKKIIIIATLISIAITATSAPFFFHFTNFLNLSDYVVTHAWGYGGYEMAQIMNELPNAENINVWVDEEGFHEFFVGKWYWRSKHNPFDPKLHIDYLILTPIGEKILTSALREYENGTRKKDFYVVLAKETPILEYYNKTPAISFCINNNPNDCINAVKFN